ncbi:MAG: 2-amino-4-hydroxy-6-hydroxymethyldihydropteridine diphosphokinase [Nitrospiria bacterium]
MRDGASAFIGIGSNIGNRLTYCQKALQKLQQHEQIRVTKVSSLYESEPVGFLKQNSFYNAVISIETNLAPETLLSQCQEIESNLGKNITIPKGPRSIDLDLLFYHQTAPIIMNKKNPDLILPHPEISSRSFVLLPLFEIAPDFMHPVFRQNIKTLLDRLQSEKFTKIKKCFEPGWEAVNRCKNP